MNERFPNNEAFVVDTQELNPGNQDLLIAIRRSMDDKKTADELAAEARKYSSGLDRKAFLAMKGESAVGFVEVNLDEPKLPEGAPALEELRELAHIARIGVLEESRGQGIAKMLLTQAEDYVRTNGKKGVWLDYLALNEAANRLYASSGYSDYAEFNDNKTERTRRIAVKYFVLE